MRSVYCNYLYRINLSHYSINKKKSEKIKYFNMLRHNMQFLAFYWQDVASTRGIINFWEVIKVPGGQTSSIKCQIPNVLFLCLFVYSITNKNIFTCLKLVVLGLWKVSEHCLTCGTFELTLIFKLLIMLQKRFPFVLFLLQLLLHSL